MFTLSSPHNHTTYCDGKSTAEEMVRSAIRHGFVSMGFSSHAKQDFDVFYAMDEEREAAYIQEIKYLQEKYRHQIKIWLGMERDSYSYADRTPFEYVMGAVHYLPMPDGQKIPVDGPMDMVKDAIDQHFGGESLRLARAYYARLGEYIQEYQPNLIAHFDLIMKNNRQSELFDPEGPEYIKAATDAMDEAITGCDLLEINTGGMARHGAAIPYPTPELLAYWRQIGGQVILSADCHQAEQIAFGYERAAHMVREAGFKKAAMLGRHDALFDWIDVN
jgi:histidinol-phosphatase (PHP family)